MSSKCARVHSVAAPLACTQVGRIAASRPHLRRVGSDQRRSARGLSGGAIDRRQVVRVSTLRPWSRWHWVASRDKSTSPMCTSPSGAAAAHCPVQRPARRHNAECSASSCKPPQGRLTIAPASQACTLPGRRATFARHSTFAPWCRTTVGVGWMCARCRGLRCCTFQATAIRRLPGRLQLAGSCAEPSATG